MSVFGSKPGSAGDKPSASGRGAPAGTSLSIVGAGMHVRGDMDTDGVVKIEGTVEGTVRARAQVLVAKGGLVHGDIETAEAVIGGAVDGSILARERVDVQAGATVEGDVTTRRIAVADGAKLNGQVRMGEAAAVEGKLAAAPAKAPEAGAAPAAAGGAHSRVGVRPIEAAPAAGR